MYRPQFEAALRLLARVSEAMVSRGLRRPVLVGGAAAEFYSGSAISTGDFDLCTPAQQTLEDEMQKAGFVRPAGAGRSLRGWVHPELALGFEVVADFPMDGNIDRSTLLLVENLVPDGAFVVVSVEDLIADRVGQWHSGSAPDRLAQARQLLDLHGNLDTGYLERRIREETMGEHGIETVRATSG
jgi:hypothetical protein